jgi:ABC-type branched-subunit amino acid transport system substrate-binding protein
VRRLVAAATVAAVLSACGSTVQLRDPAALTGSNDGLGGTGSTGTSGLVAPPDGGTAVIPGPGQSSTATPGGSGSTGTTGGSAALPSARSGASGRGYTATTIRMGFTISSNGAAALGSFGLGASLADQKLLVRTWVDRTNAAGGINGRKLVPVYFDYSATGNVNTQDQAACAAFTQDTTVFAATGVRAGATGSGDSLTPCLAKAGVPWLSGTGDDHKWRQYLPAMYSTADMSRTREERVLVQALAAQGILTSRAKIGVIINDSTDNMTRAVREGMVPALARLGLTITRQITIVNAQSESTGAELQMFAAGVTHVLFAAPGGAGAAFFMLAANSQRRSYVYGVSTQDAPGIALQSLAPAEQLKNAHGYGYRPGLDVDDGHQPPQTAPMRTCFDFYKSRGFGTTSLNRPAMALICDSVTLVREALAGVAVPTQAGFARVVDGFGTGLAVASTFQSRFSATQHDGIGAYRDLGYSTGCSCFVYSGAIRSLR